MLTRVDRIQLLVPDRAPVADRWAALLGAEPAHEDVIEHLGARRTSLRLGKGWVELLQPDGAGTAADALSARGAHLFSAGMATGDLEGLVARLSVQGLTTVTENGQAFLAPGQTGSKGLRVVFSPDADLPAVGDVDFLYEVTLLTGDAAGSTSRIADLFGLDPANFVDINSPSYGYDGVLTRFRPDTLDRFEVITPTDPAKTMGRFHSKVGDCYYMAFAESDCLPLIEQRALARGDGHTTKPPAADRGDHAIDSMFLHPGALGGMMLGISRRTQAWSWSGHPEWVQEAN